METTNNETARNFFSTEGLTATSASHVADMAKEMYRSIETRLDSVRFYSERFGLLNASADSMRTIHAGWTSVDGVMEALREDSELHMLCAWLREAVKTKDALVKSAQQWRDDDARAQLGKAPSLEDEITEDDVVASMTIAERNRYLSLGAECAVLGKYVHEKGAFNIAREALVKAMANPVTLSGEGTNTIVKENVQTVPNESVDAMFFKIQELWRSRQAELNGMNSTIRRAIDEDRIAKRAAYDAAMNEYLQKKQAVEEAEAHRREDLLAVATALKIVIPNNLKDIYEKVNGK